MSDNAAALEETNQQTGIEWTIGSEGTSLVLRLLMGETLPKRNESSVRSRSKAKERVRTKTIFQSQ